MTSGGLPDDALPEESAEDLYENAPCGYLSTAPDGTIVRVNRTFLELTGYRREDLVRRRRFAELLTRGGQIYHETHYTPLLRMQGAVREIAVDMVCADGSRIPVLVNSVVRRGDTGQPAVTRTAVFHATDRKRYERELLLAREREGDARHRIERLQQVTAAVSATLEPEPIGRAVADALGEDPGGSGALYALRDGDRPELREVWRWGSGEIRCGAETAELREPRFRSTGGERAEAWVPVHGSSGIVGLLCLERNDPITFSAEEREFIVACAGQAGQALERARLHERVRDVAVTLQRSMLAGEPPDDARIEIAFEYQVGVAALEVGGDWYDAFMLGGDRVGLVVGDVVGRGLAAATAMGQLRSAARAIALAERDPEDVISGIDRFARTIEAATAATMVYCELDIPTGRIRYACAGHPPPVVVPPGGPSRFLWDGRSTPLGVSPSGGRRHGAEARLEPGASVLLYTDGLVERRRVTIDHGLARLAEELDRLGEAPPGVVVRHVTVAMAEETEPADDVCVLCARLAPGAAPAPAG